MQVSQIGVHVHPFFTQEGRGANHAHPIEMQLREARDKQVIALSNDTSAVLLYFPNTLTAKELASARRGQMRLTSVQCEELEKIQAYELLLRDRLVVLPDLAAEDLGQIVNNLFKERDWNITNKTILCASGEMYDVCVTRWAEEISSALGIPLERKYLVEELSMTSERVTRIQGERRL